MHIDRARRATLRIGALAALAATGCASLTPEAERIVEVASGRMLTRGELIAAIRASDVALLGELHDNPWHHRRRGELIAAMPPGAAIVAEHLTRGERVRFGPSLRGSLVAAGFDADAWGWPLHEPLFAAVQRAGLPLFGGNLPRAAVRRIAREGEAALEADIAALLQRAPLAPAAQDALDEALVQGHCGQLPGRLLERIRLAQRARDAAMALALAASGGHPALLLAGNGHVRLDHGVPTLLRVLEPAARIVSVAFVDTGGVDAAAACTYAWITAPPAQRDDPCADAAPAPLR